MILDTKDVELKITDYYDILESDPKLLTFDGYIAEEKKKHNTEVKLALFVC